MINVCPLSLKKSINSLFISLFLSFAVYLIKGTIVHPESLPHWLGWWYYSGVVSDSSSLCSSFKLVVDLKPLLVFKACVSLRCMMRQKPSVLVSETKDPEAGLAGSPLSLDPALPSGGHVPRAFRTPSSPGAPAGCPLAGCGNGSMLPWHELRQNPLGVQAPSGLHRPQPPVSINF